MLALRLLVCVALAIPAGWFAGVLADRVPAMGRTPDGELRDPDAPSLFTDLPGLRLDGRARWIILGTAVLYAGTAYRLADQAAITLVPYLIWWCGLAALVAVDLEVHRLPDRIVLPTLVLGTVAMVIASIATNNAISIRFALVGGAAYFGVLLVFHLIYPGFAAFGDVKTGAILGMTVSWVAIDFGQVAQLVFLAILLAYVFSAVIGFVIVITSGGMKAARRRKIGMGPWMVLAAWAVLLFSTNLV
jgi:leader peptidase (prepilin peptidase)/N-methyltransferase